MYTVIDGGRTEHGLTIAEAAHYLLVDDGADYEIRPDENGGFWLWTRKQVANKPWRKTVIFSLDDDREAAEAEIMRRVIGSGHWTTDSLSLMTDEDYAQMMCGDDGFREDNTEGYSATDLAELNRLFLAACVENVTRFRLGDDDFNSDYCAYLAAKVLADYDERMGKGE